MTKPASDEMIAEIERLIKRLGKNTSHADDTIMSLITRIRKEQEDKAVMARALRKLANDVGGMKAFEYAVRDAIGNTNYSLIMLRVEEADAALTGSSTIISDMEAEIERLKAEVAKLQSAIAKAVDNRSDYQKPLLKRIEQMCDSFDGMKEQIYQMKKERNETEEMRAAILGIKALISELNKEGGE